MKVIWTSQAVDRITECARHISIDNPKRAQVWVEKAFAKAESISTHPQIGRVVLSGISHNCCRRGK